ncbi:MAG: biopolymer transporter ExbD [Gemmatimonadetes bacterium]|nr:biopolymer transporter ExbD [Gemmatimonadota bacterium]
MLRTRRARRGSIQVDAEVRLVNLIDIAFVLLIIFMITAPILQGGVDVKLPQADAVPIESNDALIITVTAKGAIFVNKTETTLDELPALVRTYARGDMPIALKGDQSVAYQHIVRVLGRLRRAGITDVGLMVDPEA